MINMVVINIDNNAHGDNSVAAFTNLVDGNSYDICGGGILLL